MDYNFLHTVIDALESYEKESKTEVNLTDFGLFLLQKTGQKEAQIKPQATPPQAMPPQAMPPQGDTPAQVTQLIALMYKYLKFYLRKIFAPTPLVVPDDFGFLATLFMEGDLLKHELIAKNTLEFSSGVEIIKRLEKRKLLISKPDKNDRRARRVAITAAGQACMLAILPQMSRVGRLAMGQLTADEQTQLLAILRKLNDFHAPIFEGEKQSAPELIFEKYL